MLLEITNWNWTIIPMTLEIVIDIKNMEINKSEKSVAKNETGNKHALTHTRTPANIKRKQWTSKLLRVNINIEQTRMSQKWTGISKAIRCCCCCCWLFFILPSILKCASDRSLFSRRSMFIGFLPVDAHYDGNKLWTTTVNHCLLCVFALSI